MPRTNRTNNAIIITAASLATAAGAGPGVLNSWNDPVDGNWNDPTKWSQGVVPGDFDTALLDHASPFTVSFTVSDTIGFLDIVNTGAQLNLINSTTLTATGPVMGNNGLIVVNSNASTSATTMLFNADCTLSGTGTILLNSIGARARILTAEGMSLTQSTGHTIEGRGQIEASLINNGTIHSNVSGNQILLLSNNKTNNNLIQATNNATINIQSIEIDQGINGLIHSQDAGSKIDISNSTITGGAITADPDTVINVNSSSTFNSVSLNGQTNILNAVTLILENSLSSIGNITVNSNASTSATSLFFNNSMTLQGPGTVTLNSIGARARLQTAPAQTLTIPADVSILGRGQIEAQLINNGLIQSNVIGNEIILNINNKTNNADIEATNEGRLRITSISIDQGPQGIIIADGDATQVNIANSSITGGEVETQGDAFITIESPSTFTDVEFSGNLNIPNASQLLLNGTFTSNGQIVVNSNASTSATNLFFNNSMTLDGFGTVVLNSIGARSRIQTAKGATLTIPPTQTILGRGQIEADLINNGLIQSTITGNEIILNTNDKANNATIEAINDSAIRLDSITLTQSPSAELRAQGPGSDLRINNSTIQGGLVEANIDADIDILSPSTFDAVHAIGQINIPNASQLTLRNSFISNGDILVNSNASTSATNLFIQDSMTLQGIGTVTLNSIGARSRIQTAPGTTLTLGPDQVIQGRGQIEADLINNGHIQSDVVSNEIVLNTNPKTNNTIIEAFNSADLNISNITITQAPQASIRADGQDSQIKLTNSTISGGNLTTTNNATVEVNSPSNLAAVDFSGMLNIPNASRLGINFATLNNGLIVVNSSASTSATDLHWNEEMILGGAGTIRLNSTGPRSRLTIDPGLRGGIGSEQRLEGIGQIAMDLINDGTIAPGLSIGSMSANQPIFFAGIASFEAEVNASNSDLLDSTSTIELHGTLDVLFVDGFAPTGYWAHTIMEGSEITGAFDTVNVPAPPTGLVTRVVNTGTEIIVGQTCNADLNLDGDLDFLDVSKFLAAYGSEDPDADLNGDGEFDFIDISLFLASFTSTC